MPPEQPSIRLVEQVDMASQEQSFVTSTSSHGSMTDEDVESSQEDLVPNPRGAVWYEGGNVIVVSDEEKFRVHASILSRASPTLRNMVSSARKTKQGREGYSVIKFKRGNPAEVEHLLRAIYRPSYDFMSSLPGFISIYARLHLGRWYDVSGAQQQAINYLTSIYPADLYDLEGREKDCCLAESNGDSLVDAVLVAWLLFPESQQDVDLGDLLPRALYVFCQADSDTMLPALTKAKSIERGLALESGFNYDQENILYEWIRDQCFTSRTRLVKERHRMMSSVVSAQSPQCVVECPDRRARHIIKTGVLLDDCPAIPDLDWFQDLDKKCGLCAHCQMDVLKLVEQERLELWGRLPEIFDLDSRGMKYAVSCFIIKVLC
ncbi:hypothetical protein EWM64_g5308 [Hericium alpestre]|uniref:BTB domain-containing protein n=1 Tax=Hericium alpestre TaxID=135208 RepID=A0A4Y9ZXF4_9AGAM|nr:hypothetical protein EWM64_g5308 [Hericium alpestre]